MDWDYQRLIDAVDDRIVNRPERVILAFLVVSVVFAGGLGSISTDAGTQQFAESTDAQAAFDEVQENFEDPFAVSQGSTQLIQRSQNVLSKRSLRNMLLAQERAANIPETRVADTTSVASAVATELDPNATTLEEQREAIEDASQGEVRRAARRATASPRVASLLSDDFNRESVRASATVAVVTHEVRGLSTSAGAGGTSPLTPIQLRVERAIGTVDSDITAFGSGLISAELNSVIGDSLIIVVPAASLLILVFLVFAYRDPVDLILGVVSLVMAIVWTFGFMGVAGIPFTQFLIAVPPLLLAVGIDFGIHAINRYREERVEGNSIVDSMRVTTDQLIVAFFIVTGTTVLGFLSNTVSDLPPIRDFGVVAAIGIVFTFLIFGIFLPAAKVYADRLRDDLGLPTFGSQPLGSEESVLGKVIPVGVTIARAAPRLFLVALVLSTAGAAVYGSGVSTTFSQEDFLPPEEQPDYVRDLPEPFKPGTYTVTNTINFLDDNFESSEGDEVTIYVEGDIRRASTLESIQRAGQDPPETFVADGRTAEYRSIIGVIDSYAARDPEFAALVARNDDDGDGVPDENLELIYDELLAEDSPVREQATQYITAEYRGTKVVYTVEGDADQSAVTDDARLVADRYRSEATATGNTVIFQAVSDLIFASAIQSLVLALSATALFLVFIYRVLEGYGSFGLVNLVPIVVTLALIAASMRALGIPINALTATILSIAIGLGTDYSAHMVHRFADEYERTPDLFAALERAVRGTGGALTGSMLTTTTGIGVLALAITPVLGQFGIITGLSIFLSYATALVVTPSVLVVWEQLVPEGPVGRIDRL
jgi:predicted RND superfamily exporter protein